MMSGAGHDSMHWADYAPTAMLFIPCRAGISHNPAEFAKLEDIVRGTESPVRQKVQCWTFLHLHCLSPAKMV